MKGATMHQLYPYLLSCLPLAYLAWNLGQEVRVWVVFLLLAMNLWLSLFGVIVLCGLRLLRKNQALTMEPEMELVTVFYHFMSLYLAVPSLFLLEGMDIKMLLPFWLTGVMAVLVVNNYLRPLERREVLLFYITYLTGVMICLFSLAFKTGQIPTVMEGNLLLFVGVLLGYLLVMTNPATLIWERIRA